MSPVSLVAPAWSGASPEGERSDALARRVEGPEVGARRGGQGAVCPDEVIDELLAGARTEEEIAGPGGLLSQLTKRLVERAMEVELTDHLGYEPHLEPPGGTGNTRNGSTPKTLITEQGAVRIDTPRDRDGSSSRRSCGSVSGASRGSTRRSSRSTRRGLSTRDIEAHLEEIYGVKVGRDLISRVTDAVMDDARAWQTRPLDDVYPVVFLDALVLKIRDGGTVQRRACYLALAIDDGRRARRARHVVSGQRGREVLDAGPDRPQAARRPGHPDRCVDGLKGFPEAIEAVFPQTTVQTCIVHLIRHSLQVRAPPPIRAGRQRPAADLHRDRRRRRTARARGVRGEVGRSRCPVIGQAWRNGLGARHAVHGVRARGPPGDLHHERDRGAQPPAPKSDQDQGHFPSEDAARKLIYLAIQNAVPQWTRTRGWTKALLAFKIHFGDRLPD